jgi:hypothetical protein
MPISQKCSPGSSSAVPTARSRISSRRLPSGSGTQGSGLRTPLRRRKMTMMHRNAAGFHKTSFAFRLGIADVPPRPRRLPGSSRVADTHKGHKPAATSTLPPGGGAGGSVCGGDESLQERRSSSGPSSASFLQTKCPRLARTHVRCCFFHLHLLRRRACREQNLCHAAQNLKRLTINHKLYNIGRRDTNSAPGWSLDLRAIR